MEKNVYYKYVLSLSSALCRWVGEKFKRGFVLFDKYVKAKPTGSAADQQKYLGDILDELAPSSGQRRLFNDDNFSFAKGHVVWLF